MANTRATSRKSASAQPMVAGTPPVSAAGGASSEPVKRSTKGRSKKTVVNEATKVADARKQASKKRAVNGRKKATAAKASASGSAIASGSSAVPQASTPPAQTSTSPTPPSTINTPPSTSPTSSTQLASSSAHPSVQPPTPVMSSHTQAPTPPHAQPPPPPAQPLAPPPPPAQPLAPPPPPAEPEVVVPIRRPRGQAGSKKRGYNLRDAMRLSGSKESRRLYRQIINTVHRNCEKYGVDSLEGSWKEQEPENLGKVFKAGWRTHPYLTPQRFPGNWAQAAIVKQFVSNQRKYAKRKAKEDGEDSDEDDDGDGSTPPTADLDGGAAL